MKQRGDADLWRFIPVLTFAGLGAFFTYGGYRYALIGQPAFGTALIAVSVSLWALAIFLLDSRVSQDKLKDQFEEVGSRLAKIENTMEGVTLFAEVGALQEKRMILGLQKQADSLQETVDILKREKKALENEVASLERR